MRWRKDRDGEQGKRYLDFGSHYGLAKILALEKFLGIHRMIPVKSLSNMGGIQTGLASQIAGPCRQINDYLTCHHRVVVVAE